MARSSIPALNVRWYDGRLVGKVVVPGQTEFAYDEAWLATGHNLSPLSVPFTPNLYRHRASAFDHLPGFLSDCLPDQWEFSHATRAILQIVALGALVWSTIAHSHPMSGESTR